MDRKNQKGQALIEVALVSFLMLLVFFAGLSQMTDFKERTNRFQLSNKKFAGKNHEKNKSKRD